MSAWPSFAVITPSFNQGPFIERTIQSVVSQDVAGVDYLVVDGGSTDDTVATLSRYASRLRFVSEPDRGQAHAVNKGIAGTAGDVIGWLNSDDVYYPGALRAVQRYFGAHPDVDVVYGQADHIDAADRILEPYPSEPWSPSRLVERCFLCQPAVFFRRRVIERLGGLDERLHFCLDYELWLRFASADVGVGFLPRRLAGSRMYASNKTLGQRVRAHAETNDMLRRHLGTVPDRWLSNFAHVVLAGRGIRRERGRVRFAVAASALTLGAAVHWNRGVRPSLRRMTASWIRGELTAWRLDAPPLAPRPRRAAPATGWRIGLDVSQTGTDRAGCGQVAAAALRALEAQAGPHRFLLYPEFGDVFRDRRGPEATERSRHPSFERWTLSPTPEAADLWRAGAPDSSLDAALGDPDIVHAFNFFCPRGLRRARLVYTLHDLGFLEQPAWTTEANRQACFSGVFRASLHADLVVTLSEASREHFLRTFPHYPAARTEVVPVASRFDGAVPASRPPTLPPLASGRFFLHVGTAEPRKNLDRLLTAYDGYRAGASDPLPLVLAGGRGWHMDGFEARVGSLEAAGAVVRLGYVDDAALRWLYQHCRAFLFPSLFEGYGLPVVEAIGHGAAVMASAVPSLRETGTRAAVVIDPLDPVSMQAALTRLATDDVCWSQLKAAAHDEARRPLTALGTRLLACYERVLSLGPYEGTRARVPGPPAPLSLAISGRD